MKPEDLKDIPDDAKEILFNSGFTYILEGTTPKQEPNYLTWAEWFDTANRRINKTELPGNVEVSTVFLGLDHKFNESEPILFETMIFGGEFDSFIERYSTYEQAEAGHIKAVEMVLEYTNKLNLNDKHE